MTVELTNKHYYKSATISDVLLGHSSGSLLLGESLNWLRSLSWSSHLSSVLGVSLGLGKGSWHLFSGVGLSGTLESSKSSLGLLGEGGPVWGISLGEGCFLLLSVLLSSSLESSKSTLGLLGEGSPVWGIGFGLSSTLETSSGSLGLFGKSGPIN